MTAPSAVMLAGMPVAGADGMLVNLADTPANRAFFGTTGTADGSSPFPQLRVVAVIARAGRAMLGAILGQAGTGEQTLLKRLVKRRPELFAGLVVCFDRNFPGHDLITAILDAGGHVIARVKAGIALPFEDGPDRGWLPDGSRMTWLNAPSGRKADRLPVRAAEHNAVFPAGDGNEEVSETCTIITTLLDHRDAPADQVREAYLTRWSSCETTFGEDKATITGAGNRTSGPVLRSGRPRLVIQEAWAWLTGTQLTRASAAAALAGEYAAARAQRRKDARPVTADEESFTAAWRHAVRSMTTTQVTATSSLEAITAAGESAARACLHTLNIPGRQRHSERKQKARPKFAHTAATKQTFTGKPQVTVFAPGFLLNQRPVPATGRRKTARLAARGTARPPRRDTRASAMPARHQETGTKTRTEHEDRNNPESRKHLNSLVLAPGTPGQIRSPTTRRSSPRPCGRSPPGSGAGSWSASTAPAPATTSSGTCCPSAHRNGKCSSPAGG